MMTCHGFGMKIGTMTKDEVKMNGLVQLLMTLTGDWSWYESDWNAWNDDWSWSNRFAASFNLTMSLGGPSVIRANE